MVFALFSIGKDAGHSCIHVIKHMAVKEPILLFIGLKFYNALSHRVNINGML